MKKPGAGALLAVPLFLCGFVAGVFPIFESDLFWHLATGRWILAHGAPPRVDPFRFTSGDAPWIDHEWLFQVLVRAVEAVGGLDALILLRAAALGGFTLLLFVSARRAGLAAGLAGLIALGAAFGVRPRFLVRPEIVTLYGIVLLFLALEKPVRPAALAGLVVAWVQFHGEALLAPVLAFLFLVGAALDTRAERSRPRSARALAASILGLPALLALALLANPYGWRLIAVPLGIARALGDLPAINPEWASAWSAPQPFLFAGIGMVAALAAFARRATGRWTALAWGLPTLFLALLALSAVRHQALFYAAAAPFAARCLAALPETRSLGPRGELRLALAAAWWAVSPPSSGPLRPRHGGLSWGFGLAGGRFPVHAAEILAAHPDVAPLYNEFSHGGYLLWRLHPPRRVFLDGRMELDPRLLHEIARARRSAGDWDAFLAREGAVGALVRYEERPLPVLEPDASGRLRPVALATANNLLFPPERWQLVEWDDETQLFLRPGAPGWSAEPYRLVRPEDPGALLARAAADPDFRAAALAEVERKLAGQPDCRRAQRLRDALAELR